MTEPTNHEDCQSYLLHMANAVYAADLDGLMRVSLDVPEVQVDRYPPSRFTCPHDTAFWVWPDQARIDALDALGWSR